MKRSVGARHHEHKKSSQGIRKDGQLNQRVAMITNGKVGLHNKLNSQSNKMMASLASLKESSNYQMLKAQSEAILPKLLK